jgi:hypothetical protein
MTNGTAIKKPIPIHWFELDKMSVSCIRELGDWVRSFGDTKNPFIIEGNTLKVKTLEGSSYDVPEGYIIIRGIKGEYYPCEPNIFQESYDISLNLIPLK